MNFEGYKDLDVDIDVIDFDDIVFTNDEFAYIDAEDERYGHVVLLVSWDGLAEHLNVSNKDKKHVQEKREWRGLVYVNSNTVQRSSKEYITEMIGINKDSILKDIQDGCSYSLIHK